MHHGVMVVSVVSPLFMEGLMKRIEFLNTEDSDKLKEVSRWVGGLLLLGLHTHAS